MTCNRIFTICKNALRVKCGAELNEFRVRFIVEVMQEIFLRFERKEKFSKAVYEVARNLFREEKVLN